VPAEIWIFYVFRYEIGLVQFDGNRLCNRVAALGSGGPKCPLRKLGNCCDTFMEVLAEYGRLPDSQEWPRVSEVERVDRC
jgi:hypothetical protein